MLRGAERKKAEADRKFGFMYGEEFAGLALGRSMGLWAGVDPSRADSRELRGW